MRAADPDGFDAKIAQGREARLAFESSGAVVAVPAAALDRDAAMQTEDTVDYYTRRAAHPNYRNAFAIMSREYFVPFDVQAVAPDLAIPVAMIHSENALSPQWARAFAARLPAPPDMTWLRSAGQTDFYDDPVLIAKAADRLADHFKSTL